MQKISEERATCPKAAETHRAMNVGEILLGFLQPGPADFRRDRPGDAGVVALGKGAVHGAGLASALWPSSEKVFPLRLWVRSRTLHNIRVRRVALYHAVRAQVAIATSQQGRK